MTREERSDYPYKAVREVLVNALIHRDYQVLGSEIHIEMFDDRMEISSPGGMANGTPHPRHGPAAHSLHAAQSGHFRCIFPPALHGTARQRH